MEIHNNMICIRADCPPRDGARDRIFLTQSGSGQDNAKRRFDSFEKIAFEVLDI
jgi:hypothetical protein